MAKYIMALDAGTTSNRCILFNARGEMISVAQKEFTQYYPQAGWIEHDAHEIWSTLLEVAQEAMENINAKPSDIMARNYHCVGQIHRTTYLPRYRMAMPQNKCLLRYT